MTESKHIEKQREHYDRFFASQDSAAHRDSGFGHVMLDHVLSKTPFQSTESALELGCGNGILTHRLLKRLKHLTTLDISPTAIQELGNTERQAVANGQLKPVCADIDQFLATAPANTFDWIVGSGILHHLSNLEATIRLMYKPLKPGGKILFAPEPNASGLYGLAWRWLAVPTYKVMGGNFEWEVEKGTLNMTCKNLTTCFQNAGFKNISIEPYQVLPHFGLKAIQSCDLQLVDRTGLGPVSLYVAVSACK